MTERMHTLLDATPGWADLAAAAGLDRETTGEILSLAAQLADDKLTTLGQRADAEGCRLEDDRVRTPSSYAETYARMDGTGGSPSTSRSRSVAKGCRLRSTPL